MKHELTLIITAIMLLMTSVVRGQVTDVLDRELTGVTGTTYTSWENVTSNSDAIYAGQSAGGNNSIQLRSNNNNSGIITTASGGTVTSVSVIWNENTSNGRTLNIYGSDSPYSSPTELYDADTQGTLLGTIVNGTSTELLIDGSYTYIGMRSASGAMYLTEIDITWTEGGGTPTVSMPTFSPASGIYTEALDVTITCNTAGATIYYTLDGSTPSTGSMVYSNPIEITETTTVKAIGVKSGMNNSAVATATYTIQDMTSITSVDELWDFAEEVGTTATAASVTFNNWYVTGVKNNQVWVSDGVYGFVIYQSGHGFAAGDKLNGTHICNVLMYQNHYAELMGVTASNLEVMHNQEMPLLVTTISDLDTRNYGTAIDLGTLTYDGTVFEDADGATIALYNQFNLSPNPIESLEAGKQYNVKGVSIIYFPSGGNPIQQLAPRSADDFEEVLNPNMTATPTFTPAAGTYYETLNVTISCATAGATIRYTLDGSTPTASSSVYTGPIAISETTTVKAIAMKAGYENSNVATAVYVIEDGPSIITIAEAKALELNEYAMVQGVVTFIDGRNVYIQDDTAGIDLFLNANTVPSGLALGDLVQAYGKRSAYNGLIELSGIDGSSESEFSIISSGNELPLETVTIAEILADFAEGNLLQSTRVKIIEATIGAINNSGNTPITQGGSEINIYKLPVVEGLVEGDIVTFIGVIGCFNNPQMRIASADDLTFYHPGEDPVLTATPNTLSGFNYIVGHGPSEAQTFVLTGENLPTGFLTLTVNNSFEISLNPEIYTGVSITIPIDGGTLEPTTVYVRLNADSVGQYAGTVTIEDNVVTTVALSGEVVADGIDETLASSVSVWNNSNELVIENGSNGMLNVVVYNIVGQPVLSETVDTGNNVIRHDLSEGVYIVRLANSKEMTGIKVVVRR